MPVSYREHGVKRNWPCGSPAREHTSFVGLAGDQFCRYLGEKAFSYCGEKDENLCEEMITRHSF